MNGEKLIGKVVNERYELTEIVGSGGMAVVYKAHDRLLNRDVAIKILKESLKDDSEMVDKFSREAKSAASLTHNNIVSVFDVGQYEGLGFIVMELIDGKTLKEYINENKPIPWQQSCEIAIQIANALKEAHEHGIVHRDIKPHNILITADRTVKVADFGIASAVSSDTVVAGGAALGSVHYISPEQARGGYVDSTSDLYSLGVVLYEMLTGTLPFDGDNAVSIALKKLEQEPLSSKVINLDIPQSLDAIVMKSISKEQHTRYKTAEEFANDLKELLAEDSLHKLPSKKEELEREIKKRGNKRSSSFNPIIASGILILIIAIITFVLMRGGRKEYIVPDLIDKTLEEAIAMIEGTEFTIDEESIVYEVSEEFEEGKIIYQNPGANQSVKRNKKIQLKISSGATEGNIPVPNVVGMDYTSAMDILVSRNLQYQIIDEEGSQDVLNLIMSQSPKADTKVTSGYTVILHVYTSVSQNNSEIEVPDLSGKTRAEAEKVLAGIGLVIGNTKKQESNSSEGQIISQEPKAGDMVKAGTEIAITISEGTAQNNNPEQQNQNTQDSQTEMKRKTLTINIPDSAGETVNVVVLANGKEIHNADHSKSEGKVDIVVQSSKDAEVEVYMDGELMVHKIVEFD